MDSRVRVLVHLDDDARNCFDLLGAYANRVVDQGRQVGSALVLAAFVDRTTVVLKGYSEAILAPEASLCSDEDASCFVV